MTKGPNLPDNLRHRKTAAGFYRWWWEPSRRLRQAGWRPVTLDKSGDAIPAARVLEAAEDLNQQVKSWGKGEPQLLLVAGEATEPTEKAHLIAARPQPKQVATRRTPKAPPPAKIAAPGSIAWLVDQYWRDPFSRTSADGRRPLAAKTLRGYEGYTDQLVKAFGDLPLAAITADFVAHYYAELVKRKGLHTANHQMRVNRLVWKWAQRPGRPLDGRGNPFEQMGLVTPAARVVVFLFAEIEALVQLADSTGRQPVGDAIMLAVTTALRLGDLVALPWSAVDGDRLKWTPSKTKARTGAKLNFPLADDAAQRLRQARERIRLREMERLGDGISLMDAIPAQSDKVLQPSIRAAGRAHGSGWSESGLGHAVADLIRQAYDAGMTSLDAGWDLEDDDQRRQFDKRLATAIRQATAAGKPIPNYVPNFKRFQDLRDTAVTWLALAGNSPDQIRAITGHSAMSIQTILKHYLAADTGIGDQAANNLQAWLQDADARAAYDQQAGDR